MRVMMIGDVVSQPGCDFLRQKLPAFKKEHKIDAVTLQWRKFRASATESSRIPQIFFLTAV